jgi:sigma-B regulation protein RsbU (phosphoserine phosphatase)
MALTRSLIRAESRRSNSPRAILLNINQLLLEMSTSDMFVTVFFGILDTNAGILRYSRAGHDRPLRVDPVQKTCELLEGKGNALGVMDHPDLDEIEIQIFPGELLVMYTDGIVDAQSMDGRFFGQKRLKEAVCTVLGKSAISTCSHIFERTSQFMGDGTQYDDMALLVVKAESES